MGGWGGCSYRLNAIRREVAQTGLVKVGSGGEGWWWWWWEQEGGGGGGGSGIASFARLSAT